MIKVRLKTSSRYKGAIGQNEIELELSDKSTINDLVYSLVDRYGKPIADLMTDKKTGSLTVIGIVNGTKCKADKELSDGDAVMLIPPLAGG